VKHLPPIDSAIRDAEAIGLAVTPFELEMLDDFADLLLVRNARVNLVGPSERGRIWCRHVLESLAWTILLEPGIPVVDIGSGAGFPGLVLAIHGYRVVLVEPRRMKHLFHRHVIERLGLKDVEAWHGRIEDFGPARRVQFTARAVTGASSLLEILSDTGSGSTLTLRGAPGPAPEESIASAALPSPPLDRPGMLVQYRVP
jgi:16S rRNA (guanine(527)-N(7))-methyltransferase RsmG